jgi:SAM-dependent methyltransferase
MSAVAPPDAGSDAAEWNRVAEKWLDKNPHSLWREHSDAVNTRLLEKWLPYRRVHRILKTDLFDEAVSGGLVPVLSKYAEHVVAIDVSPAVVNSAADKYPALTALTADVRELPWEADSFDAVVSLSTLDHFDSPSDISSALSQLFRVLKPSGTLILTLDNGANPIVALRNALPYSLTHAVGLVPYPVGTTLTPDKASAAVTQAGFTVGEVITIMHPPRVLAVPLMSALEKRAGHSLQSGILRTMLAFEKLGSLPTRRFTGHFIAIRANKPAA